MTSIAPVMLGARTGPRPEAFKAALARQNIQDAVFFGYDDFADRPDAFERALKPGAILRFDSPDRDPGSIKALYAAGHEAARAQGCVALTEAEVDRVIETRGMIGSPSQLALGLQRLLQKAVSVARARGAKLLAGSEEIATTFDKLACSTHLAAHQIPVARNLGMVTGFDDFAERMRQAGVGRVFLKLRHGSSAAGMTALAFGPRGQIVAYTTAEIAENGDLFATRNVRKLTNHAEIAALVDRLAPLGLYCETWLPKANVEGSATDLRVITVNRNPVFSVLRMSKSPMTNLHLGGQRHPADGLRHRIGETAWRDLIETCRRVADAFPTCFMLGIDIAALGSGRKHAVLEVNAFGDHVNGVEYRGCPPQDWQIMQWRTWLQ
jgi:glutathione synthase/RimK-type ligase-like ATP-grasp enzyme